MEAFKNFAQDIFHPLLCMFLFAIKKAWMSLVKGFSALFTPKKSVHSSPRVPRWRLSSRMRLCLTPSSGSSSVDDRHEQDLLLEQTYSTRPSWQPPAGIKVVWIGTRDEEGVYHYWHRRYAPVSSYDLSSSPSWVMGGGVRGLASPHPILGATTSL